MGPGVDEGVSQSGTSGTLNRSNKVHCQVVTWAGPVMYPDKLLEKSGLRPLDSGHGRTQQNSRSCSFPQLDPQMCQLLPLSLDIGSEGDTKGREDSNECLRRTNLSSTVPSPTEGIHVPL